MGVSGESALERLSAEVGRDFPNLFEARKCTAEQLAVRRTRLAAFEHDSDASIVLMGSWGRGEVTSGSDDDFMVLVDGAARSTVKPSIGAIREVLDRPPAKQGPFGEPVFGDALVENIGLDRDDNRNLTRRMLLLLESVPVTADSVYEAARAKVLGRYLDESTKEFQPPRFLLNDTVRYWRTVCVDFAGKEREGPEKWGLRNAKLRNTRKVLFAGGLLPILDCSQLERSAIHSFFEQQLSTPPTDRIAHSFLEHGAIDAGGRTLGSYDEFLGLLGDERFRRELAELTRETADRSEAFAEASRLGRELEAGLLALLFETDSLSRVARDYAIF